MSVSIKPSAIALTLTPSGPNSLAAIALVIPISPAFEAE